MPDIVVESCPAQSIARIIANSDGRRIGFNQYQMSCGAETLKWHSARQSSWQNRKGLPSLLMLRPRRPARE